MPGIARFLKEDEKAVYHVISRTALDGLPFIRIRTGNIC
jgi:hypothetical protein